MKRNDELLKKIKRASWANKESWEKANPGKKMMSTYAINASLEKEKDWNAIAQKCSENPNHQYFGVPAEEILIKWKTKADKGAARGNTLDDYMKVKLSGSTMDMSTFDDILLKKCKQFDNLYDFFIAKLDSYVGSEIWLNSAKLGLVVRIDSLFTIHNNNTLLVGELKNTENMSTEDRWNYLIGPAKHLQQTDFNKYSIQMYIYKYILEELGFPDVKVLLFNIKTDDYHIKYPAFPYDSNFIKDCAEWCHSKQLPAS